MSDTHDQHNAEQTEGPTACLNCGATSADRLLIAIKKEDKDDWVCARCLPQFIHGQH